MKPRVYLILLLLIIPCQAGLLSPLSLAGIKPDLALAAIFVIGLLTGPAEASLAGIGIGLVQDIGSAGLIGFAGFTRGLAGLAAGLLGGRVLDLGNPMIPVVLAAFSVAEGIFVALFLQVVYGSMPFLSLLAARLLPQALYTGFLGYLLLRLIARKRIKASLLRGALQKES